MTFPERYAIRVKRSAERDLESLPREVLRRVADAIRALKIDPRSAACKKLRGGKGYRVRVGDYRVLYSIDDSLRIVEVAAVGHRRDVYR